MGLECFGVGSIWAEIRFVSVFSAENEPKFKLTYSNELSVKNLLALLLWFNKYRI